MKRWSILTVSLVVLLGVAMLLQAAAPQIAAQEDDVDDDSVQRTIHVSGTGQVNAEPDVGLITVGVETQAEEASAALSQNSQQMQAIIDALLEADIPQENIQTRVVQLSPRYDTGSSQAGQPSGPPEIIGYTATNLAEVRVTNLDNLGQVLDSAAQAGANRISNIQFEVSDPADLMDQAREAAWADALHKAEQLTSLADEDLGAVLQVQESSQTPGPIISRGPVIEQAASVPVEAGTQTITVNLDVTWLLQ
jgi:uncharacterized protein YggE